MYALFEFGIRAAKPDDAEKIAMLLREAFIEFEPQYNPASFAETVLTPARVSELMDQGPIWIAECQGRVIGTVSVARRETALRIRGMAVLPKARAHGVGRSLLNQCEKHAIANGFKRMVLWTTPFLSSAIALYERYGFRRTDERPHDLCGTPLFAMSKSLSIVNKA